MIYVDNDKRKKPLKLTKDLYRIENPRAIHFKSCAHRIFITFGENVVTLAYLNIF